MKVKEIENKDYYVHNPIWELMVFAPKGARAIMAYIINDYNEDKHWVDINTTEIVNTYGVTKLSVYLSLKYLINKKAIYPLKNKIECMKNTIYEVNPQLLSKTKNVVCTESPLNFNPYIPSFN